MESLRYGSSRRKYAGRYDKNWVGILNKQGIDTLITKMQQSASQPIIFNQ